MPSSTGVPTAGFLPSAAALALTSSNSVFDLLAGEERRCRRVGDLDLLQHLAHDHLDVLVVDLHALQPVDVLDLVDQVVAPAPRRP
jgi:hypothetical protein